VRYNLGDEGEVVPVTDVLAILKRYGIDLKPRTKLPLLFVWGRDSTVYYNAANVSYDDLERAISLCNNLKDIVAKSAFYVEQDAEGNEKMQMWVELKEGVNLDQSAEDYVKLRDELVSQLEEINQEFSVCLAPMKQSNPDKLPELRIFEHGKSPMRDATNHRKQVLIFRPEMIKPHPIR